VAKITFLLIGRADHFRLLIGEAFLSFGHGVDACAVTFAPQLPYSPDCPLDGYELP
jgi:hypothetical protein